MILQYIYIYIYFFFDLQQVARNWDRDNPPPQELEAMLNILGEIYHHNNNFCSVHIIYTHTFYIVFFGRNNLFNQHL